MEIDLRRITLGNIISIISIIGSMCLFTAHINSEIAVMKTDISWIKASLSSKNDIKPLTPTFSFDNKPEKNGVAYP